MKPYELAYTQLEIAYLNSKLTNLTSKEVAVQVLSDWLEFTEEMTVNLIRHCAGVRYPAAVAAHLYRDLGFTYDEISKLVGKSKPTIVDYFKRSDPMIVTKAENTPFSEDLWITVRKQLDVKMASVRVYGLHAKNSIL